MRTMRALTAAGLALILTACGGSHSGDHDRADQQGAQQQPAAAGGHAGMNMADVRGDGVTDSADGYTITGVEAPTKVGKPGELSFTITGPTGSAHKEFVLELTKLMHTYVVREDLTAFQHVHPTLDETSGRWSVPITFPEPGPYRVVAEFEALTPDGNFDSRVLGSGFTVRGETYQATAYTPSFGAGAVDGYELFIDPNARLHGPDLTLRISKGGVEVTNLQPYLQSWAHVTGFRRGNLAVVHMHPTQGPGKDPGALGGPQLNLAALFATAGKYRLFVQFQTDGVLHTAPVDVDVIDHTFSGETGEHGGH